MRRLVLFLTLAATIGLAPPASASKLTVANGVLTFTGNPGANNEVTLSGPTSSVRIVVEDADTIEPGGHACTDNVTFRDYSCPGVSSIVLYLNSGDDTVTVGVQGLIFPMSIQGGEGADTLVGGSAADVLDGGPGADDLTGGPGSDQLVGGDGSDQLGGGTESDTLEGGAGNDDLGGGTGNDTLDGGTGDDYVGGGGGDDRVNGGDGDDNLGDGGGSDVFSGGAGFDKVDFDPRASVSVSIDGVANDGAPGETGNLLTDVEDVYATAADSTGAVTLTGSDVANELTVGTGIATINGLSGTDSILGSDGNDTISARDGYPDRIRCYGGTDTVLADSLDTVSTSCENVLTEIVPGPAGLDDRPPTVAWGTPASAASFRGEVAQSLSVTATDDRGVAKVQFYDEDRLLCEDSAAPYTCNYQARGADVGRNTLIAVATDTAGQAGSAIRLVTVGKFRPTVPLRLLPSRDRRAPYKFTASGTLTNAGACSGTVTITAKAGKRTVSTRRAKVNSRCRYSIAVSFKSRVRSSLKFTARYEGNTSTAPRTSSSRTARLG